MFGSDTEGKSESTTDDVLTIVVADDSDWFFISSSDSSSLRKTKDNFNITIINSQNCHINNLLKQLQ